MLALNPAELIQIKEQGDAMPSADLRHFILDYTRGDISNEIMTGLLKAIYNNGMTPEETFALTESMLDSGERMDFSFLNNYVADKTRFLLYLAHLWLLQDWPSP